MPNELFLPDAIRELERCKGLADQAIAQVPAGRFCEQLSEVDNSIAIIVKHVAGNIRSRWTDLLTTDGEKPDRNRDAEFEILGGDSQEALLARWNESWTILFSTLRDLSESDLGRTVTIRGEPLTVLQAITRQLTHYAYHIGQIVYLARHLAGPGWKSLSIPKGKSAEFNQAPARYIAHP